MTGKPNPSHMYSCPDCGVIFEARRACRCPACRKVAARAGKARYMAKLRGAYKDAAGAHKVEKRQKPANYGEGDYKFIRLTEEQIAANIERVVAAARARGECPADAMADEWHVQTLKGVRVG